MALIRQEGKDKLVLGASIAGAGLSALALFHLQSRRMIGKMCVKRGIFPKPAARPLAPSIDCSSAA